MTSNSSRSWLPIGIFLTRSIWPLEVSRVKDFGQCHAGPSPMPRRAVADEAGPWKVRLIERTVQLAGGCYRTSMVDRCLCMQHRTKVISLSDPFLHSRLVTIGVFWIAVYYASHFFKRLRLSCDSPFSRRSGGATAKRMLRRLTNVLRSSLGIRS